MDIKLRLQYLNQMPGETFPGREALTAILNHLNEAELLEPFGSYVKNHSSRHRKIKSTEELIKQSESWSEGSHELYIDRDESGDYLVKATLDESQLWFLMAVSGGALNDLKSTILQKWSGLVSGLFARYSDQCCFGPTLAAEIYDFSYPQPRPQRKHPLIGSLDLISFFSKKFHREHSRGNATELDRLLKTPLPAFARLEEKDDLVILRWIDDDDLTDESALRQKLAEKEDFLAKALGAPLAPGWNEAGDQEVSTLMLTPHPPLTFYDGGQQTGYKAVYIGSQGESDEAQFALLADWLESGELPDGTPLKALGIVVQGREQALKIEERARAQGIEQIFYTDNEGRWWNAFFE